MKKKPNCFRTTVAEVWKIFWIFKHIYKYNKVQYISDKVYYNHTMKSSEHMQSYADQLFTTIFFYHWYRKFNSILACSVHVSAFRSKTCQIELPLDRQQPKIHVIREYIFFHFDRTKKFHISTILEQNPITRIWFNSI